DTMAAPNLLYFNGFFFLSTEVLDSNVLWATKVFYSTSPTSGFQPFANALQLTGGNACMFQHVFDNVLHVFNCTTAGTVWTVTHRTAPLELVYADPPPSSRVNVASAASGATVTSSSFYNSGYAPAGAIDGDRKGVFWSNGGGWNDGTLYGFPDWLEVDFAS